jgi:hypothetical protein
MNYMTKYLRQNAESFNLWSIFCKMVAGYSDVMAVKYSKKKERRPTTRHEGSWGERKYSS